MNQAATQQDAKSKTGKGVIENGKGVELVRRVREG